MDFSIQENIIKVHKFLWFFTSVIHDILILSLNENKKTETFLLSHKYYLTTTNSNNTR